MNILGLIIICLTIYWIVEEICSYLKEKNRKNKELVIPRHDGIGEELQKYFDTVISESIKKNTDYRGMDKIAEEICREE